MQIRALLIRILSVHVPVFENPHVRVGLALVLPSNSTNTSRSWPLCSSLTSHTHTHAKPRRLSSNLSVLARCPRCLHGLTHHRLSRSSLNQYELSCSMIRNACDLIWKDDPCHPTRRPFCASTFPSSAYWTSLRFGSYRRDQQTSIMMPRREIPKNFHSVHPCYNRILPHLISTLIINSLHHVQPIVLE